MVGRALTSGVVLQITNPNNPTGEIMTEGRLREILAWALSKGIHLVRWVQRHRCAGWA